MALQFDTSNLLSALSPYDIAQLSGTLSMFAYEVASPSRLLRARCIAAGDPPTEYTATDVDALTAFSDDAVIVGLTATTAMVVYDYMGTGTRARILSVSGTTITANSPTTLTDAPVSDMALCYVSSTAALYCYLTGSTGKCVILSVSGTTITENTIITFDSSTPESMKCAAYSTAAAIITFAQQSTSLNYGIIISISGTSLTANTRKEIESSITVNRDTYRSFTIAMSSTKVVHGVSDPSPANYRYYVLTLNGTTFNVGTSLAKAVTAATEVTGAKLSSTSLITVYETDSSNIAASKFNITGASSDELTEESNATYAIGIASARSAPVDGTQIIVWTDEMYTVSDVTINAFRFLGFAADGENLYISGLKDQTTLKLYDYDLAALGENGTTEFGSGTEAEIDAATRGVFPVIKPMQDNVLYLRGRDGNNVQVQYNDRNGTLGWTDIGPGTATWGTDKYAVALLPEPTNTDDVIVVFSDNDVYRTQYGTATWSKTGDASSGLRAAARLVANQSNKILAGGTAAGTVEFSHNFGASFADVSGTILGTINAFEVSL